MSFYTDTLSNDIVVALYDFTGLDDELSFKKGDILHVTEKKSTDWWYGMDSDGRQGFIPVNYVEIKEFKSKWRSHTAGDRGSWNKLLIDYDSHTHTHTHTLYYSLVLINHQLMKNKVINVMCGLFQKPLVLTLIMPF